MTTPLGNPDPVQPPRIVGLAPGTECGPVCHIVLDDITVHKQVEEALRKSAEYHRAILKTAMDGIWLVDMQGRLLEVNEAYCRMSGYSEQELLAMRIPDLTVVEAGAVSARIEAIMAHGQDHFESRHRRKDGSLFDVEVSVQYRPDDGGRIVVFLHDITVYKQVEEALRKSEAFFRDVFERHAAVKLIIDPETGTILNANRAAADYYGWPQEQLCRMRIQDINTLSLDEVKREMEKASRLHRTYFEFRHRRADGSVRDVAVFSSNISPAGKPVLYSIVHDITGRKLAEDVQTFLLQCGLPSTGEDFFASLARYLAGELGMDYVCIDRLEGDGLMAQTVAVYNGGRFESNVSYALRDTPCGEVLDKRVCCFPQGVRQLFPKDAALQDLNAESYFGVTLWDSKGQPVGLIAVIGHHPLVDTQRAETLLGLVAPRAAFELERRAAEEKLRTSEAQFSSAFESAPIGMALVLSEGRFVKANRALCEILGYSEDELQACAFQDITHPDDLAADLEFVRRLLAGELDSYQMEKRYYHKSGRLIWALLGVSLVRDSQGRPLYFVSQVQDISVRKEAERQRNITLQVLGILNGTEVFQEACRRLLEVIQREFGIEAAGIRIAQQGEFRYVAHVGFPQAFVASEDHLCARNADGTVQYGPGGQPLLECTCGLVLEGRTDPASPLFSPGGSAWTNDATPFAHIPADQDPRLHPRNLCITEGYKSIALIPIRSGVQIVGLLQLNDRRTDRFSPEQIVFLESLAGSIGIALARRQSEEEVRESQRRYDQLAEQNRTIAWEVDATGLYTYVSPVVELVLGFHPAELVGKKYFYDLHPKEGREAFKAAAFAVFARQEPFRSLENPCRTRDGRTVWVVTNGMPILDAHGTLLGYRGSDTDITARKQAESQLHQAQKMESIGQLAGGVAHDFNNLLMGIMGYAEMCRDQVGSVHPICEWLDEIMEDARRSSAITRQLLAFARRQPIAPVVLDLNDTVSATLKMLRRLIGEDIELRWMPGAGRVTVKMDPSQVDQILANLAVNARDAIGGVGKLTITTGRMIVDAAYGMMNADAVPGDYVTLAVSDTGCGMDKATVEHIFEPFFTTKEVGKGTGLGLATVYGIVRQNNGFVTVESEPGQGTTFTIYLPRWSDQVAPPDAGVSAVPDPRGTETVLLAEDEKSVRITTGAFLTALGYTVLPAETPEKALRLAAGHAGNIHLLITDVVMPGLSGRDLAKQLAAQRPAMRSLFISGYTADIVASRGVLDKGMDFLSKPFTRAQLACIVRTILDRP